MFSGLNHFQVWIENIRNSSVPLSLAIVDVAKDTYGYPAKHTDQKLQNFLQRFYDFEIWKKKKKKNL